LAYNIIDVEGNVNDAVVSEIKKTEGIINVRKVQYR